jgi:hypothetical protein
LAAFAFFCSNRSPPLLSYYSLRLRVGERVTGIRGQHINAQEDVVVRFVSAWFYFAFKGQNLKNNGLKCLIAN